MADEGVAAVLGLLILGTVLAAAIALLVLVVRFRRSRRDAQLAQQWEWALDECVRRSAHLAFVCEVYQKPESGCKAVIEWYATGQMQDTWFKGWHAPAGVYAVLHGRSGWGPHNSNPDVLYVEPDGVIGFVPGDCPRAWQRHQQRLRGGGLAERSIAGGR